MDGYRCFACDASLPADFGGFVCPSCGGNLDVTYDYASLDATFHDDEGMFRYAALLPVEAPDNALLRQIGATPLYGSERLAKAAGLDNLFLKDDTGNPSASIKDRASAVALLRALNTDATTVSVASTGNAGSSTACLAAAMDLRAVVFVPADAPAAKLTQSLTYGATVLAVHGNYDDAYDLCLRASQEYGWFNRSTGFNPFTREGKKTCSYEIWEQLGRVPDRVVVPTGDGNILSGVWKGWCDLHALGLIDRLPRIDCAQAAASAAISNAVHKIHEDGDDPDWSTLVIDSVDATTVADSISVDQPRDGLAAARAVIESGGAAITMSDADILAAVRELASSTGVFAEPSAAASWAAVRCMARDRVIRKDDVVVCLVTGSGLKDIGSARSVAGAPLEIEPTLGAVRAALSGDPEV